jgi:hypothetical protein
VSTVEKSPKPLVKGGCHFPPLPKGDFQASEIKTVTLIVNHANIFMSYELLLSYRLRESPHILSPHLGTHGS